jgi:hypothetical protein
MAYLVLARKVYSCLNFSCCCFWSSFRHMYVRPETMPISSPRFESPNNIWRMPQSLASSYVPRLNTEHSPQHPGLRHIHAFPTQSKRHFRTYKTGKIGPMWFVLWITEINRPLPGYCTINTRFRHYTVAVAKQHARNNGEELGAVFSVWSVLRL